MTIGEKHGEHQFCLNNTLLSVVNEHPDYWTKQQIPME